MVDIPGYIFGGNTGITTPQELERRRAAALAVASRRGAFPKTLGEGMTYFGEAVGDRMAEERLKEMELAQLARDRDRTKLGPGDSSYGPGAALPSGGSVAMPGVMPGTSYDPRGSLAATLVNENQTVPQEVAQANPTEGLGTPSPGGRSEDAAWSARMNAIAGIESSGDYRAVGVPTKYGRALGRYGVVEANIPKWTQQALGQALTPQQFLASDRAQDLVFKHKFGEYVAKHGEEGAARAWFGGEGNINKTNLTDAHKRLSIGDYGKTYLRALGQRAEAEPEEDGAAPVQVASLRGPSGTMSDAPPPGMGGNLGGGRMMPSPGLTGGLSGAPFGMGGAQPPPQAPPPGPQNIIQPPEPDPTVTADIQPMTAPAQIAQAPAGGFPGSVSSVLDVPTGLGGRPPSAAPDATVAAPDMPPSKAPIPPASEQEMEHPGAAPKMPDRLGISGAAKSYARMAQDPLISTEKREWAARQFQLEEGYRKELQARKDAAYVNDRERWEKLKDAYDKFKREAPERAIDQLTKRIAIETNQVEADKKRAELEDILYKQGIPREQARTEADLKISEARGRLEKQQYEITQRPLDERGKLATTMKTERDLAAPEQKEIGGVIYERTPAMPGVPAGEWTVARGSPKKETKITETDSKSLLGFRRATIAASQIPGDASILAGLKDTATGKIPIGGNYWVSPEYQRAFSAAGAWIRHTIRHESGAAITPSEIPEFYPVYFPVPGDNPDVIAAKVVRRREATKSMMDGLSGDARDLATQFLKERETRRAVSPSGMPHPEGTVRQNRSGKRQRVIGGHWEDEGDLD